MPLVIDTFNDYFFYLQYRRRCVPLTIKANKLALRYFSSLYGNIETEKLTPTHMVRFHEKLLATKRQQRNHRGEYEPLSRYSIYKIMVKLRAYIRRLEAERMLGDLKPIDVPVGDVPRALPKYLTKEELKQIVNYLDNRVKAVSMWATKTELYHAYLHRAVIRFLYTTWLRNAELRTLKMHDVNMKQLTGAVLGKGNKYAPITFSETAREHLQEYHRIRRELFPSIEFPHVFTPYTTETQKVISEQWLNNMVKDIAIKAGVKSRANTHVYRHTLWTHLVQDGYPISAIRDKLRHSSTTVTSQYLHSNPVELLTMTKNIDTLIPR